MEYLSRKSNERVISRPKLTSQQPVVQSDPIPEVSEANIDQIILELKFLCPGPSTRSRAEELWIATFRDRDSIRKKGEFHEYTKLYSVGSAFDGVMISLDFDILHPGALDFQERFIIFQDKILARYDNLYQHVQDEFMRALAIIRIKNPSRGAKRTNQGNVDRKNPLDGIIEWVEVDNPFPVVTANTPVLYVKAKSTVSFSGRNP
ncbi:uncharacterized protein LOC135704687 [Ochlerotatus camptorhynchus]|uniref:uncharacterized protein LOC135704687 n=1 Tax=Ochlerotatus camptorhynchus TaxID=644619 RepID=UPI0031E08FB6